MLLALLCAFLVGMTGRDHDAATLGPRDSGSQKQKNGQLEQGLAGVSG
jgi:hypothetical protein